MLTMRLSPTWHINDVFNTESGVIREFSAIRVINNTFTSDVVRYRRMRAHIDAQIVFCAY